MASSGICVGLVLVLVGVLYGKAMAQSGCSSAITSLASCLSYVTGNTTTPSSSCCSQLANVVQSSPQCLCSLLNNNVPSLGITINQTLALSLPGACNVQAPPISQCKAAPAPTTSATAPTTSATAPTTSAASPTTSVASSPAASPADSSNETPEPAAITPSASNIPPSSSGTGSKTVPSTDGTSDGTIVKASLNFVLFAFFVLWCGSAVTKF